MKKGLLMFLLLTVFLCGCVADPVQTVPSASDTSPTAAVETLAYEDLYLTVPEEPGSALAEYDPDRQIYVTFYENAQSVFSVGEWDWELALFCEILSKQPLDPENVTFSASVPCEIEILSTREYDVRRETEWSAGESNYFLMPYYVYQAYRGVDFSDEVSRDSVKTDFTRLQPEHLPEFHAYSFVLWLNGDPVSEPTELEYVDVTVNGEVHRIDPGVVIIHPPEDFPYDLNTEQIPLDNGGVGFLQQAYNDGYGCLMVISGKADRDLTIENAQIYCPGIEVLDWQVNIQGTDNNSISSFWDGQTPIDLYEGDVFSFELYFKNTALSGIWSGAWTIDAKFSCVVGGEECYMRSYSRNTASINLYELYAVVFDGIDMEPYYRDYYYQNYDLWIKEYQE